MILKKLNIFTRVQFVLNGILLTLFIVIGLFLYNNERKKAYATSREKSYDEIEELSNVVDIYRIRDRDILNMAGNFAEYKINQFSYFEESDSAEINFEAVNPLTDKPMNIIIHEWFVDEVSMHNNYFIVDEIKKLTKVNASIYQKTPKGYVNVSTNIFNTEGDRLLGDVILNSSEIIQAIESGNKYFSRIYRNKSWYQSIYKPIYIDGRIRGMYYISLKERIASALKPIFDGRTHFKTGYTFLITSEGRLSIHPKDQGVDYSNTNMFSMLKKLSQKWGSYTYMWPENELAKPWCLNFKYEETIDSYICITYPKKEIFDELNIQVVYVLMWFVIFIIGLQVTLFYLNKQRREKLKAIFKPIAEIVEGKKAEKIETTNPEFSKLYNDINIISDRYALLVNYAKNLVNNHLDSRQPESLKNDPIGLALINLDDKLLKSAELEKERAIDAKLRKWESDGLSKFINILQQHTHSINELSDELINNLVEYLKANQGALFFLNNENPDDIFFEQMATYAYNKKRLIEKKIYPEEGLIGRLYTEKKSIYLSEIPENYIRITSGLGELEPNYLLIIPLLLNMEVYGVIELASFNKFEDYQIEFLEKIGENIASTINNVQINAKTRRSLEQSGSEHVRPDMKK